MSKTESTFVGVSITVGMLNKGKAGIYVCHRLMLSLPPSQSSHLYFKKIQGPAPHLLPIFSLSSTSQQVKDSFSQQRYHHRHAHPSNHGPWWLQPHLISHSRPRRLQPRCQNQRNQQTQQPLQLDRPLSPCQRRRQRWLQLEFPTPTKTSSSRLRLRAGHLNENTA
jgi:hypothetical protein